MLGTILRNIDGITLELYVGTELRSLLGFLDDSNYDKLEGLLLGDSLEYTDGKVTASNEGIKLGYTDGKVLGTMIGNFMESHLGLMLEQIWAL